LKEGLFVDGKIDKTEKTNDKDEVNT